MNAKQKVIEMIQSLPGDPSVEEILAELNFRAKVDARLAALDRGEKVPHEEALARLRRWSNEQ
ncbi:MAG: hypothetical protein AB7S38_42670 [Vulcanimicrobiota bacterium]